MTRSSGFTFIELLVVVAIIGILAAVGVVVYQKYISIAQTTAIKSQNNEITASLESKFRS